VAWFDGEELVGLAPFYISDGSAHCCLRPVGGIEIADYLDILAVAGREEEIYNAFLDHLESPDARRKRRRLYRFASDVRYHVVQPHEDLQSAMDRFVHLHRRSHPDKAAFMTPQMEMFFRDPARR